MPSTFPSAPDNIRTDITNATAEVDAHPNLHNDLANAINAIETNLISGTAGAVKPLFPAGTAALPSITFAADTNTGLYNPAADQIGFSTNGTLRWYVDASGNLLTANEATFPNIGATAANRPWIVNVARSLVIGGASTQSTDLVLDHLPSGASGWSTLSWKTNALNRFALFLGPSETGSNAGGDLVLQSYNDAGAFLATPLSITRSTGSVAIPLLNPTVLAPTGNVVEQRNGVNIQTLDIYYTFTDISNYVRLGITNINSPTAGNGYGILMQQSGTGVNRPLIVGTTGAAHLIFRAGGTDRWGVASDNGAFNAQADNTYDIGYNATTNRPRTIYAGTSVVTPALVVSAAPAFVAGDRYLVVDASGNVHKSAIGPAS